MPVSDQRNSPLAPLVKTAAARKYSVPLLVVSVSIANLGVAPCSDGMLVDDRKKNWIVLSTSPCLERVNVALLLKNWVPMLNRLVEM